MRLQGLLFLISFAAVVLPAVLQAGDGQEQRQAPPGSVAPSPGNATPPTDPFAGVTEAVEASESPARTTSWMKRLYTENLGFRKEIMSQFNFENGGAASRQSLGFEVLKKFSNSTSTIASFDFQGRLVRRDGYVPVLNDMEGAARPGWSFEYHNLYLDFYNVFNPFLKDAARSSNVGRFNFRVGRFYVPFGLNLQTDTHGTLLQLSNEANFGFERDWYAGFWGSINRHLNYDAYYLAGSGYDLKFKGQGGLGALRISLSNQYSSRYGLEGGVSLIAGSRLPSSMQDSGTGSSMPTADNAPIRTSRIGIDGRYRHTAPGGLLTFTTELSGGHDARMPVYSQLYQAEYLRASRRWGLATQYRSVYQEGVGTSSSLIGEFSWYFRNDVGNSNSHWIALAVERKLGGVTGPPHTVVALQYYLYR